MSGELMFVPDHLHHRDAPLRELAFLLPDAGLPGRERGERCPRGPARDRADTRKPALRSLVRAIQEPQRFFSEA